MSDMFKSMFGITYALIKLVVSLVLVLSAGIIGSAFTFKAVIEWYPTLEKPFFSPPNWLFGPVWTLLYIMMAVAFFLIWQTKHRNRKIAMTVFIVHLAVNAFWSILFFSWHNPMLALIDLIVLWLMIVFMVFYFYGINKKASWLLWPYLLWVSFAGVLNLAIWWLN